MAVEVIRGHYTGGAEMVEKYELGSSIVVEDGHLFVKAAVPQGRRFGKKLASFAPGNWQFARVTDADGTPDED